MVKTPESVATFLRGRRIAVAGVSRQSSQAANAVFRKLRGYGYEVFPINPNGSEVEGARCYRDVAIAYAVAATLEELYARDRIYRVADLGLFARIAAYFNPALRPNINVSSIVTVPDSPASPEKKSGLGKLSWSEYSLIITALCTAGAIYYAQQSSSQVAALTGTITANGARITSLEGLLKDSNDKRDEYANRLVDVNRYLGQLEGQADAQTEQQKKMLGELRALVGKVDKVIQDNTKPQKTSGTDPAKK